MVTISITVVNHELSRLIRFISRFTAHPCKKFCKYTLFSTPYMCQNIRCDVFFSHLRGLWGGNYRGPMFVLVAWRKGKLKLHLMPCVRAAHEIGIGTVFSYGLCSFHLCASHHYLPDLMFLNFSCSGHTLAHNYEDHLLPLIMLSDCIWSWASFH